MHTTKPIYYLASPYSHADSKIRKHRAYTATEVAVQLLRLGVFVFAPIPYNEPWEQHNLPGDWSFWCDFDKSFIERCDGGIIVLTLDGWKESVGVTAEVEFARALGRPIYYVTKEQIDSGDLSFLEESKPQTKGLFCQFSKM